MTRSLRSTRIRLSGRSRDRQSHEKLGQQAELTDLAPTAIHVASVVEEEFTSVYPDENVNVLVPLLQRYKLVVVYDSDHRLIGQVSASDLLKKFQAGRSA